MTTSGQSSSLGDGASTRHSHSLEAKLRIVEEARDCQEPKVLDALLRREGISSSQLSAWGREHEILTLLADYLDVPVAELLPERTLAELGMDSVDAIEIVYGLEEKFGIELANEDPGLSGEIVSVGDLLEQASTHIARRPQSSDGGAPP